MARDFNNIWVLKSELVLDMKTNTRLWDRGYGIERILK